jgi:hypothetical protein
MQIWSMKITNNFIMLGGCEIATNVDLAGVCIARTVQGDLRLGYFCHTWQILM